MLQLAKSNLRQNLPKAKARVANMSSASRRIRNAEVEIATVWEEERVGLRLKFMRLLSGRQPKDTQ